MPSSPQRRLSAEGWTYAAPNPQTGRWHAVVDDRAACSEHITLDLDQMVTVGRAPARPRCKRRACRSRWQPRVSQATRERDHAQRDWAEQALIELSWSRSRQRHRDMWERQGWLVPHFVYVLRYSHLKVHRVGLTAKLDVVEKMRRRAGDPTLVDLVKVPNRHAAVIVQAELLARVDRWRRELTPDKMPTGGAKVWSTAAPPIGLAEVVADLELD